MSADIDTPLFSCRDMVLLTRLMAYYTTSAYEEGLPEEVLAIQAERLGADFLNSLVPQLELVPIET